MRWAIALAVATASGAFTASALAGTVTVEQQSGRNVRVFVPGKPATPTPLVVMLHGCTQTADAFADATQMDAIAEKEGFVVAYPEQSPDTISTRCFRWYESAHQARDAGEPKELADAALAVAKGHGVDPQRIYVAGISAGAAMSVILGATYPDRFVAIGVVAGVEYKGATTIAEGFSTASNGGPDPDAQGDLAHAAMGTRARVVPTFVVHGTSDGVLAKVNGDQVAAQWRRTNTLVLGDGAIEPVESIAGTAGYTFTHMVHRNKANGASVIEYYVVDNLGHAWPGGKDGGSYSDKSGPDASALLWGFFNGRTLSAPLDVAPIPVPDGPSGTSGDAGASGSGSGASPSSPAGAPGDSTTTAPGGSSSSGCSVTTTAQCDGLSARLALAAMFAVAILVARRRAL
jgi:poly(hydroxyalkanoate) depolymerase family esterase